MKQPAQDHTANPHSLEFRSRLSKPRVHVLNHCSAGLLTSCDVTVPGARVPSRPCPAACFPCLPLGPLEQHLRPQEGVWEREKREREPGPPMPWNSRRADTPRSLGPDALHIHLAPAGRWGRWSVLPACQLAQDARWLAPRPLGWAYCPPPTGTRLAVRSRWAGRPGPWLSDKLPAGFAAPGALAPLGWHCWAGGPTRWLPMDGQLARASERRAPWAPLLAALLNVWGPGPVGIEARTHPAIAITLKHLQGEAGFLSHAVHDLRWFSTLQPPQDAPHSCTDSHCCSLPCLPGMGWPLAGTPLTTSSCLPPSESHHLSSFSLAQFLQLPEDRTCGGLGSQRDTMGTPSRRGLQSWRVPRTAFPRPGPEPFILWASVFLSL